MTNPEVNKLASIVGGEEVLLQICSSFPNKRLPGKRFCNRILRKRFNEEFKGEDLPGFTQKYGVCLSTLYNWLKK
jgi:hypothetical protein